MPEPLAEHKHCFGCGEQIFGGPDAWHTADGRERCVATSLVTIEFHEPMVVEPGDFECCDAPVGLHVDRYHIKWGGEVELAERITRDEDIHCTRTADGKPALPLGNAYAHITDWHADDECEAHKSPYSYYVVIDGETHRRSRPLRPNTNDSRPPSGE